MLDTFLPFIPTVCKKGKRIQKNKRYVEIGQAVVLIDPRK